MNKKISFAGPWITQAEVDYVAEAAKYGHYEIFDKYIKEFEEEARKYFGVKYALGTHCATLALHLACEAIGLGPDDEVIVTDHSWVATAYAVSYTKAKCIFVDIDPLTLCIDPSKIEQAITPKTKAIMMVHNFGIPAKMNEIMAIAKKYDLKVIEDAAPAMGALYKGQKCGTIADIGCISFQGAKIAISQEGGLFLTNNKELYDKALLLSSMGRTDREAPFWSDELGYQYTIGSLPSAMATVQMRRIDELVENKRKIYSYYKDRLGNDPRYYLVHELTGDFANYTYPSIWLADSIKHTNLHIIGELKKDNIHCRPGFPQMSKFPVYKDYQRFENPVAYKFWKRGIVLPAAHNLVEEDIDFVCKRLNAIVEKE